MTSVESFYTESTTTQPLYVGENGRVRLQDITLSSEHAYRTAVPDEVRDDLGRKIVQLYQSVEPVTVKVNVAGELRPYQFEIGYLEQGTDTELRASSYSSSFTGNPGNVTEVAEWAAFNPNRSYAYVASPGNGLTSPLAPDERKYYRRHGRLFFEDEGRFEPMPFIKALHLALKERGITPTRLGSDSAGAVVTTAYGTLPEVRDEIRSVHQNVRTNIENRPVPKLAYGMLYTEGRINGPKHTKATLDPLSIPKWDEYVRQQIPDNYRAKDYEPGKSVSMLVTNIFGLGRGPGADDPALLDNSAFLRNNSEADVLFTNGREDPLVDANGIDRRMHEMCERLSRLTSGRVMSAIIDGASHGPHTFYPQFIHELSRATLG